jgi:hypothetical protein
MKSFVMMVAAGQAVFTLLVALILFLMLKR